MPVKSFRPLTPSTRYITISDYSDITKSKPEKSLVQIRKKSGGRNSYGRVTARGIGGGHKQKIRLVDFKRNKHGIEAEVTAIEYDPIRTARLALLTYKDGEKRYIIAPVGLSVGAKVMSGPVASADVGNCIPLKSVPVGLPIHAIELTPGKGAQIVRSAGSAATRRSFWARLVAVVTAELGLSAAVWLATRLITRMVVVRVKVRVVVGGSN